MTSFSERWPQPFAGVGGYPNLSLVDNQGFTQPVNSSCDYYNAPSSGSQCYEESQFFEQQQPLPQQNYYNQRSYVMPNQVSPGFARKYPIVRDLPCHQSAQPWDYNNMCFNVDGQACQYTDAVDLEDFMNNEKRKEKSRVAARCRRTKEMQIFNELTEALPARKEEVEQLDKASVMRLAISYLRVRDVVTLLPESQPAKTPLAIPKALEDISSEVSYMKALDGFVLVLSQQGDIVYCSENISEHLGVSQMEIMGQSVFEFSHPCDHDDVRDALRSGGAGAGRRELLLRLKCTLTGKGRNVHLKSASYKVIHVTGHMLSSPGEMDINKTKKHGSGEEPAKTNSDGDKKNNSALVAVGRPIPHPSNIEVPFDSKTFLSKHSLDMKFTYTDDSLQNTLGFEPEELLGKSLYDYHHAGDTSALAQQFKSLFSKGQCETGQYRFLARSGGYAWVQTQATVITDKQQKPVSVVCINYVVSGIECKDEVFAPHQLQKTALSPKSAPGLAPVCSPPTDTSNGAIVAIVPPEDERPIPVTELIFAPRKKEMNKGFLMFSQDEGFTMFKDEPEDLTHLAPTAGDACIPLENSPFDMFDEFILNDNYCSLLGDDLANSSPVDSLNSDPMLLSSPEPLESDSSCERSSLLTELSLDRFDNTRSDGERDGEKSPFIPLSDELPLLEPAVMWGALPDSVSLARPQPSETQVTSAPALQRLLVAPPTGPPPQDLITNIYSEQGLLPSKNVNTWDTGVKRVMKQVEEPNAKRVKREPSPAMSHMKPKLSQSSSVLMNLLDLPQPPPLAPGLTNMHRQILVPPNYQLMLNSQKMSQQKPLVTLARVHHPNGNSINLPHKSLPSCLDYRRNSLSPLSLNVSPMGSMPSSPNSYSPAISPAHNRSPYATPPSVSPNSSYMYPHAKQLTPGILQDPYLTNKMQTSPILYAGRSNLQTPIESLLDTTVPASPPDFWTDAEMLQTTSDLLTALDDVKLV